MIYIEYEAYKSKYYDTQKQYNDILNEKEKLFSMTQPKTMKFDGEPVEGGVHKNIFDEYLLLKEQKNIDQRLKEIKAILEDRENLLSLKEEELKNSTNVQDKIYVCRYINRMKVYKISRLVGYSEAQIYRLLKTIKSNINKDDRK